MAALLEECWEPLVRYLMTIVSSRDQAKDAGQEAFVSLWAGRDNWVSGSARGLLFRLGRNAALDMLRKEKVRSRWASRRTKEGAPVLPTPEDDLVATEFTERFREALDGMPARRREVFELVRFRGLSYAETASALELSRQTVANQMALAHKGLRRRMADVLGIDEPVEDRARHTRSNDG